MGWCIWGSEEGTGWGEEVGVDVADVAGGAGTVAVFCDGEEGAGGEVLFGREGAAERSELELGFLCNCILLLSFFWFWDVLSTFLFLERMEEGI